MGLGRCFYSAGDGTRPVSDDVMGFGMLEHRRSPARLLAISFGCMLFFFAPTVHAGDAASGADVFKKCRACHLVGDNARHAVGPALNGIVGSKAGSAEGYPYSDNLRELGQSGMLWTEEQLGRYLENPKAVVPKGKMAFPGLADPQDRADLIAYLKTLAKP